MCDAFLHRERRDAHENQAMQVTKAFALDKTAMNMTEKLALWGVTHAAARDAERAAAQQSGVACEAQRHQARLLRERADSLHREICLDDVKRPGQRISDRPAA
jgi:hypothetical protein